MSPSSILLFITPQNGILAVLFLITVILFIMNQNNKKKANNESDEFLQGLDWSPTPTILINMSNDTIVYLNGSCLQLFDASDKDYFLHENIARCFHPSSQHFLKEGFTKKPIGFDAKILTIKNDMKLCYAYLSVVYLQHQPYGLFTFLDKTKETVYLREIEHRAYYDALTNVYNRLAFNEKLHHAISRDQYGLLIMCDLDGFKQINDTYGHLCGDEILKSFAKRVQSVLRSEDLLFRFGGDEFCLYIAKGNASTGQLVMERIFKQLDKPVFFEEKIVYMRGSFGGYTVVEGLSIEDMLQKADHALYESKKTGKGKYILFREKVV